MWLRNFLTYTTILCTCAIGICGSPAVAHADSSGFSTIAHADSSGSGGDVTIPRYSKLSSRYVSPVGHGIPRVFRDFSPPAQKWLAGHRGVDVVANIGDEIMSAGDGIVVFAGFLVNRHVISIEHEGGLRTTYEPVEPRVTKGDYVTKGQVIGVLQTGLHASGTADNTVDSGTHIGSEIYTGSGLYTGSGTHTGSVTYTGSGTHTGSVTYTGTGKYTGSESPTAGNVSRMTGLHWGAKRGETYINPLSLLGKRNIRLF
ncbi:peptidoglycan DD-metalloendopeptidase family protein [Actinotignum urinale]|uniref:M23 family metallopeptidase n=1 Tax=Actinotignum urinale TaxID=190146 RepID=UPI002A832A25|nr:peptidoglycan DD-metalloendopeptidase family protein [Actinotignum urinale]MDY5129180.1 peptidoglycan DD-metalloendopeptidase family protein [Actinotignum urinale]